MKTQFIQLETPTKVCNFIDEMNIKYGVNWKLLSITNSGYFYVFYRIKNIEELIEI